MTPDQITFLTIGGLGAAIGFGKLLLTGTPLTRKLVIGTPLVSAGISLGALATLAVLPGLSFPALVGLAATFSVVGVVGLEMLLTRIFGVRAPSEPPPPKDPQ